MIAAFYATFDDLKGPTVAFEDPAGSFDEGSEGRRVWELYSEYVMSGNSVLDGRVIVVRSREDAVVCLPAILRDGEKYKRNALLFSVGMILPGAYVATASSACRGTLERVGAALRALELESSALSQGNIADIVPPALRSLRLAAAAAVEASTDDGLLPLDSRDDPNVALTLQRQRSLMPKDDVAPSSEVAVWDVPVLLARPRDLLGLGGGHRFGDQAWDLLGDQAWDLAIQQVIPHVDGIRSVRQVAKAAHVDVDITLRSLRVLRHYGCLTVVDVFQYSNVYRATARVGELATSQEAQDSCVRFVLRAPEAQVDAALREPADQSVSSGDDAMTTKPAVTTSRKPERAAIRILRLYCDFRDGKTLKDVLLAANDDDAGARLVDALDHRAFAAFGAVHGILRRVHCFPIATGNVEEQHDDPRVETCLAYMDGTHCMDEICSDLELAPSRVMALLRSNGLSTINIYR